jgi:hypothetical protein
MGQTVVGLSHLPQELIIQILGYLNLGSNYNLARTCRRFYVLWDGTRLTAHDKQKLRRQQRHFAMTRSIKEAESWYCEACNTDHPVSERDTPATPDSTCPARPTRYRQRQNTHGWEGYFLRHRHLQMILNYSQKETISVQQEAHLNKLTLSFNSSRSYWSLPFSGSPSVPVTEEYIIQPRVYDGRLIIYYEFTYHCPNGVLLSAVNMPAGHVCRHITMRQLLFDRHGRLEVPRDAGPPYDTANSYGSASLFREMILGKSRYAYAYNHSQSGVKTCKHCSTEYLFLNDISRVKLLVFKDYGENKSPFDLSWRVQSRKGGRIIVDMRPRSMPWAAG